MGKERMQNVTQGGILILCDFDGTVCTRDMGNEVLSRFTKQGWEAVDQAYCSGEIGSRDAYSRVPALFTGTKAELLDFVRSRGTVDPYFPAFYAYCMESGFDLKIVSDGLDIYIEAILEKYHLESIPYFTNRATFQDGRFSIEFPQMSKECGKCGTCKNAILNKYRSEYALIVYVGDGYSDICPSKDADMVFAKGILYGKFMDNGMSCEYYETFKDVHDAMIRQISDRLSATAKPAIVGLR
jgi:2-hydroxy-3-keto-5-methylthiopentenyl-1-phosphate phosphatase